MWQKVQLALQSDLYHLVLSLHRKNVSIMTITLGQLLVWLIIGALVGTLVGRLVSNRKRGFGWVNNLVLGIAGALVGGILFDLLDITIGGDIVLTFTDFVAAFVGALLILGVLWVVRR